MSLADAILRAVFVVQDVCSGLHGRRNSGRPEKPSRPDPAAMGVSLAPDDGYLRVSDGTDLFYSPRIPDNPRQVLACFHGMGAYGGHFRVISEYLMPEGVAVYLIDLRGHGLSEGGRGDLSDMARVIADLDEIAEFLKNRYPELPLYFLGESLGASMVLKYAAEKPDHLKGIILSGAELRPRVTPKVKEVLRYLPNMLFRSRVNAIEMGDRERLVSRDPEHFPRAQHDPLRSERFSVRTVVEVYALIREWPQLARRLSVPCLILQGGGDLLTDPQAAYELEKFISCPDKELAFFPGVYHGVFYDPDTPRVLAAMSKWLSRHQAAVPHKRKISELS